MSNARFPRYPAEGFAMALNRMLDKDRRAFMALINASVPINEELKEDLGLEHVRMQGSHALLSIHHMLNYILADNLCGVVFASQALICRSCYRTAMPPARVGDRCVCGGEIEAGEPAGYFAAPFRERPKNDQFAIPPLFHTLAMSFMQRFVRAPEDSDALYRVNQILNLLLRLFEEHGDIARGQYQVIVQKTDDMLQYQIVKKEECRNKLQIVPETPEA